MSKEKTYVFRERITVVEESVVKAENYDDAVSLFIGGEGDTKTISSESISYDLDDVYVDGDEYRFGYLAFNKRLIQNRRLQK